jgi:urease accessory protein
MHAPVSRAYAAAGSGGGALDVVRRGARSVVARAYAASPLCLLTPRNHGHAAWAYTGSLGGGLVGGDAIQLRIGVGAGASAFVSTQASTKVYRSAEGTSVALDGAVAAGAQLIVWPDPVVCFADSRYDQRQAFALERGASLVVVDGMTSGRRGSGERWRFDRYTSRLTVSYDGRLVLADAVALSADEGMLASRMGRFDVLCTVAVVCEADDPLHAEADRMLAAIRSQPLERRADLLVGGAPLGGGGCVVRLAGRSAEDVGRAVTGLLSFVPRLLGDDPWARKW